MVTYLMNQAPLLIRHLFNYFFFEMMKLLYKSSSFMSSHSP